MKYDIMLDLKEYKQFIRIVFDNGLLDEVSDVYCFLDDFGNTIVAFKATKNCIEKVMYFLPDCELKHILQGKIDFWLMNDLW